MSDNFKDLTSEIQRIKKEKDHEKANKKIKSDALLIKVEEVIKASVNACLQGDNELQISSTEANSIKITLDKPDLSDSLRIGWSVNAPNVIVHVTYFKEEITNRYDWEKSSFPTTYKIIYDEPFDKGSLEKKLKQSFLEWYKEMK